MEYKGTTHEFKHPLLGSIIVDIWPTTGLKNGRAYMGSVTINGRTRLRWSGSNPSMAAAERIAKRAIKELDLLPAKKGEKA